jgi:DNA-binding PadR family transcriptional regulator
MLGGSSKPRFTLFEDEHPTIMSQLDLLEEHGLVKDVTPIGNKAKIYRMSERLVMRLASQATQG